MKIMEFASQLTRFLEDKTAEELEDMQAYVADKDGEVFHLSKVVFNPETKRVYVVRGWVGEEDNDYLPWDKEIPTLLNQA